jgi:hypothetical protein
MQRLTVSVMLSTEQAVIGHELGPAEPPADPEKQTPSIIRMKGPLPDVLEAERAARTTTNQAR